MSTKHVRSQAIVIKPSPLLLMLAWVVLSTFSATAHPVLAQDSSSTAGPSINDHPLMLLWQTAFDKDSALIEPDYVTVDAAGNSYVGELSYGKVKQFDRDGKFVRTINIKSIDVTGIAVDSDGNILIAAWDKHRIEKFDAMGRLIGEFISRPTFQPTTLGIDQHDNLYVVDGDASQPINQKFDLSGSFLMGWGKRVGAGDGEFGGGTSGVALAIDRAGNVYFTDQGNNRIQKFDTNGTFLIAFALPDDGPAFANDLVMSGDPYGVAVDGQGNIYVSSSHFLRKLDPDGNILAQWPTTEGELYRAGRVAVDADGNIYIVAEADVKTVDNKPFKALVLKKFQQS
jgi:sugar lactone lactonase YvrE